MKKTVLFLLLLLFFPVIALAQQAGGLPALQKQVQALQQQIQALQAQDANLQSQINNIQLTPGPKGDKGDTGATGATGAKGDKGDKGDQGLQGVPGMIDPSKVYFKMGTPNPPYGAPIVYCDYHEGTGYDLPIAGGGECALGSNYPDPDYALSYSHVYCDGEGTPIGWYAQCNVPCPPGALCATQGTAFVVCVEK